MESSKTCDEVSNLKVLLSLRFRRIFWSCDLSAEPGDPPSWHILARMYTHHISDVATPGFDTELEAWQYATDHYNGRSMQVNYQSTEDVCED